MNDAVTIPLTRGLVTVISPQDVDYVAAHKWLAQSASQGRFYVCRADYENPPPGKRRAYLLLHRELLQAPPHLVVDHINGDSLDNRRENLRLCTISQNAFNKRKQNHGKLSKYKGVAFVQYLNRKNPWMAFISVSGKRTYLGYFPSESAAALAYNNAAIKLHKDFAHINIITPETSVN